MSRLGTDPGELAAAVGRAATLPPATVAAARRTCARHATSPRDLTDLLDALGITPDPTQDDQ